MTKGVCELSRVLLCLDVALFIKSTHLKASCMDLSPIDISRNDLNRFYNDHLKLTIINKILKTKQFHIREDMTPTVLCFACDI